MFPGLQVVNAPGRGRAADHSNLRTLVHLDVETLMVSFVDCNGVSLSWGGGGGGGGGVVSLVYRVIALFITLGRV